jgi:pimeloyl-ACP methyl ester carboxylesterase
LKLLLVVVTLATLLFLLVVLQVEAEEDIGYALYHIKTPFENCTTALNTCITKVSSLPDLHGKTPLILVHGWQFGGDDNKDAPVITDTWGNFLDFLRWDRDIAERYELFAFRYDTDQYIFDAGRNVDDSGGRLAQTMKLFGSTQVVFIAHSMGGLVVRSYMVEYGGGENTIKLITLGTPFHGSPLAGPRDELDLQIECSSVFGSAFSDIKVNSNGARDLAWDNYDNRFKIGFNGRNRQTNTALVRFNSLTVYNEKIIAYGSELLSDDIPSFKYSYLQDCLEALGYPLSDGVVPLQSALFEPQLGDRLISRQLRIIDDYNHSELTKGKGNYDLFEMLKKDLLSIVSAPPTALCQASPKIFVIPKSGPQGRKFWVFWIDFSPNNTLISHLQKPDGSEFPIKTFETNQNGKAKFAIDSSTLPVGQYTLWAEDNCTKKKTKKISFIVENPNICEINPFACVDIIEPPLEDFLSCAAGEDSLIDDLEIVEILDAWQKQKDYRGCGVPTDDDYMKALASWIKRQPVNEDDVSPDLNFIVLSHYITDIIPDYYNPNQARTEFDANKVQETGLDVYVVVKFNGKLQEHNLEWQFFNPQGVWEETVWFDAPDNYTNNFAVAQHFINPAQKEILGRWTIKFFIDGKFQFEDSFIISQTSGIPEVTFVQIPEFITMNTPTGWQLGFFDPDANVVKVRFEQFVSGNWQGAGEFDPGVRGQTQGKISVTTTCHKAGLVRARVSLIDETGNRSEFKEYSFSCVGDEGSRITTIILRANYKSECPVCVGDHCYDFPSVKCVRFEWQYESNDVTLFEIKSMYSDRSGYSEIINRVNPVIREYSELLTEDKKVCVQVRAQTSRGFTDWSNKVCATVSAITPSSRWKPELSNKIVIAKAQIFSLTGQLVYDIDFGDPQKLVWDLRDYRNLPIANGVYLVVITTTDIYGLTRREIKKIVVLR